MTSEPTDPRFLAMRSLKVDSITADVVGALEDVGVESVLMKGPITQALYPSGEVRRYNDTDLLVPFHSLSAADKVLLALGFKAKHAGILSAAGGYAPHATTYVRGDGASVDLHHSLPLGKADARDTWPVIQRHTSKRVIAGREVNVLNAAATAFQLAVHVVQHPDVPKNARDLEVAIDAIVLDDWRKAAALADELNAMEAFAEGLSRSSAGLAVMGQLDIGKPDEAPVIAPRGTVGFHWLSVHWHSARGWKRKLAFMFRMVVPEPRVLRQVSRLARRGGPWLPVAYIGRPFVLLLRLGPSLVNYIRAKSADRANPAEPRK